MFDHSKPPSEENYGIYYWQKELFDAGLKNPERCLIAANRVGKTETCAAEVATHMTGYYPDWWEGRKFNCPISAWTGANTNEASRDIVQHALLGPEGEHGTGMIPRSEIDDIKYRQAGVPNVVDLIRVKSDNGGHSIINLKTYDQGFQKWMGTSKHLIWLDEESPMKIYTESLTRLLDVNGILLNSFTPLLGRTPVVNRFLEGGPGIYVKNITWDDAPHLDEAERERLKKVYPEWERDSRSKGMPMMGEGAVFPISDEDILCDPFKIPKHFYRICGIDFGIHTDHPAAGVWLVWDKDADVVYVTDCYKKSDHTTVYHAEAIKSRGQWIPVAWPHDGMNRDKGKAGPPLYKQYRAKGVMMLKRSARYDEDTGGTQPVEPIIIEILERMKTGRFRVFRTCNKWMEEKRRYHRKEGRIVAAFDDIMAATRVAMMDLRKARVIPSTTVISHAPTRPILGNLHGR